MNSSFRWKLMGSYLLLVLVLGAGLYAYLSYWLEQSMVSGSREHLKDEARAASLMASKEIRDLPRDAPALTAALSRALRARVTVVAPDGVVVGDSEVGPAELSKLENHGHRPEIVEARKSGMGSTIRYSATLKMDMMYVAAPFGGGMIRLALPLSELEQAKGRLRNGLAAALAVGTVGSMLLSYVLSNVNSRHLRMLAARASRIGRGEFGSRIPVTSSDELGKLAQVINDMTARIEQQLERLSSEKNRLDAILKGIGEGIIVTDQQSVVTMVNPAFCTMMRTTERQVLGKQLLETSRNPDLHDTCREVLAEQCERHQEISLAEGEETLVHWVPLLEGESLRGAVAVFHDITALKRVEKIRRDFVANVSHELRTPVTVIKGYAETLLAGGLADDPQRRERFLGIIQNHADRLSILVRDLLTISELESGEVAIQQERITLEGVIRHALLMIEQRAEEKKIALQFTGCTEGLCVLGDRRRIDQVLINLLDNAVKYSRSGGTVTVTTAGEGEMVRISVQDSGIGIPKKDIPRLFERFYRVDEARSRDKGGTGLGLSIVKHIVQAHGGSVAVDSTEGVGSTFSFTLPTDVCQG
jgi:two-component system, OmpR family, phosphate regulon sensor histidine kinase PhoR